LQAVIREHYALAGRSSAVTGQPSPMRSELLVGFEVSDQEVDDLVAFLASLTDAAFLKNPRHGNPWGVNQSKSTSKSILKDQK
jgi:cytochrome c peroxidase